jgi:RND family efflux transporter MFP subunit
MPVEVSTLAAKPVEQTSEFIATLKSRRSTTIQPQVEGFLTRILVRSGERVAQGATLFEIDSAPQQAALASLESMRSMREAELTYAREEADRSRRLFGAGAISQRERDQADTAVRTSEAQVKSVEEQIRQQRSELNYYRVTAPTAGVVGDVPVRVGDRVTKSTELTTVDENDVLELYVNVPVQQAPRLRPGLPVRILDDTGQVIAENRITFVSPSVDDGTQSVLAKAMLTSGRGRFRADQFVRAQMVWSTNPGLTIPMTSVVRINGTYFVYLVADEGGKSIARQRAVQLGEVIGNDYVLIDGAKPGERLIVGGIQKIGDGSPVMVGASPAQKAS